MVVYNVILSLYECREYVRPSLNFPFWRFARIKFIFSDHLESFASNLYLYNLNSIGMDQGLQGALPIANFVFKIMQFFYFYFKIFFSTRWIQVRQILYGSLNLLVQ